MTQFSFLTSLNLMSSFYSNQTSLQSPDFSKIPIQTSNNASEHYTYYVSMKVILYAECYPFKQVTLTHELWVPISCHTHILFSTYYFHPFSFPIQTSKKAPPRMNIFCINETHCVCRVIPLQKSHCNSSIMRAQFSAMHTFCLWLLPCATHECWKLQFLP